ncbi:MAG: HU family DNA-binding protein [Rickettsiales bacterium]
MNKQEIIAAIADEFDLTREKAKNIVEKVSCMIIGGVKEQGKIVWPDLGTFSCSTRNERKGRNPMTGEAITIPKKNVPKFTPTKKFKEEIA